jgi:hypothetical protein
VIETLGSKEPGVLICSYRNKCWVRRDRWLGERVVGGSRRSRAATQRCFKYFVFPLDISRCPVNIQQSDSKDSHGENFVRKEKNMRIWIYYKEGIVRIKIPPDQEICIHSGGRTEEGCRYVTETYFLTDEGKVGCVVNIEEGDCDGSHSSTKGYIATGEQPMNSISREGKIIPLEEMGPVWIRAPRVT